MHQFLFCPKMFHLTPNTLKSSIQLSKSEKRKPKRYLKDKKIQARKKAVEFPIKLKPNKGP